MKENETVIVRPKFKMSPRDVKRLARIASITGFSMSQFVKNQVKIALDAGK